MHGDSVLYPMVGVGAFFALFWTGFVAAWELGLPCPAVLCTATLCAGAGAWAVARIAVRESRPRPRRDPPTAPIRARAPAGPRAAPRVGVAASAHR